MQEMYLKLFLKSMSFTISIISVEPSCHMYTHLLVSARSISYIVWIVDVKTS